MRYIQFYEYQGFVTDSGETSTELEDLNLSPDDLMLIRNLSTELGEERKIFEIGVKHIKATSFVGVIAFNNIQIEILPKLLRNSSDENNLLGNLMEMLRYTHNLDLSDSSIGSVGDERGSFLEVYINIFADYLKNHLVRHGPPKNYQTRSENLTAIRGKINFPKNSVVNLFNQSRVFCDYSEFTADNKLSQAFKFVANSLLQITSNSGNLSRLRTCIGLLDDIEPRQVPPDEILRAYHGGNKNLRSLIGLTILFLKKLRPSFQRTTPTKTFTLLFDMNELFEEFIFQVLRKNAQYLEIQVYAQKKKRLVSAVRDFTESDSWTKKNLFDTYSDIVVVTSLGHRLIIDTKYKIIGTGSHDGIKNPDAYQVLAYRQIHQTDAAMPAVLLLYPEASKKIQKQFKVAESDSDFFAWTIDIGINLNLELHKLIGSLKEMLDLTSNK